MLSYIRSTLEEIGKGVKGLAIMTPDLESIAASMAINKVPQEWLNKSYPSRKTLPFYYKDLLNRCIFLQKWVDEGIPPVVQIN